MNVSVKSKQITRIIRAAASIAVISAMTFGVPTTIATARTVVGVVDTQAIADINPDRLIYLTLIKSQPGVVEGITFTVRQVDGVDLTTAAGWSTAKSMTIAGAKRRGFASSNTADTDADGRASFSGLPVGLYLVTETPLTGAGADYEGSAEFLITLPTGGDDGESWNYDVEVFTKDKIDPVPPPTTPVVPPSVTTKPTLTPKPTPTPVKPVQPVPTTAVSPPVPGAGSTPGGGGLASTGANVAWLAGMALFLMAVGSAFLIRNRRTQRD